VVVGLRAGDPRPQMCACSLVIGVPVHPEGAPQQPGHRTEGNVAGMRFAVRRNHRYTTARRQRRRFRDDAALADSSWSDHRDDAAVAFDRPIENGFDRRYLPTTTDQARQGSPADL
jgi:hypothetical protein